MKAVSDEYITEQIIALMIHILVQGENRIYSL